MSSGEKYLFGAYAVLLLVLLVYVGIIALKLGRMEREIAELVELARERKVERELERVG